MTIDAQEKVVTVASTSSAYSVGGVTATEQVFVAVHDSATGSVEKIKAIAESEMANAYAIAADASDLLVGGSLLNDKGQVLLRLGSNLALNDSIFFLAENPLADGDYQYVADLAVDAQRNLLLGGYSWSAYSIAVSMNGAFTNMEDTVLGGYTAAVGFDRSNRILVATAEKLRRFPNGLSGTATVGSLPAGTIIRDLAVDHSGNVLVAATNGSGAYVAKVGDSLQSVTWSKTFVGTPTGICVDSAENVIVLAHSGDDLILRSYTTGGSSLWNSVTLRGSEVVSDDVVCDSAGNVFGLATTRTQFPNSVGYSDGADPALLRIQ